MLDFLNFLFEVLLHILFTTPIKVPNPIYPDRIKEIYLFLEQDDKIKAIVFTESTRPRIVVLNYDSKKFIKEIQLGEHLNTLPKP